MSCSFLEVVTGAESSRTSALSATDVEFSEEFFADVLVVSSSLLCETSRNPVDMEIEFLPKQKLY